MKGKTQSQLGSSVLSFNFSKARSGFTMIEVVVALAMLALIAVPAIGLATMSVGRSKEQMNTSNASELKARVDVALRSSGFDIFTANLDAGGGILFYGSSDLQYIETGAFDDKNDKYYRILVREPENYNYTSGTDAFRLVVYEVTWPNGAIDERRQQVFFTTVFKK